MIEETEITRAIVRDAIMDFLENLNVDVAIAGGGPSGLVAAKYLADKDVKVIIFERKLSVGNVGWRYDISKNSCARRSKKYLG